MPILATPWTDINEDANQNFEQALHPFSQYRGVRALVQEKIRAHGNECTCANVHHMTRPPNY